MIPRLLISVGVLLGIGAAVQAHEVRQIGAYTLVVGFPAEPAFEDVANAMTSPSTARRITKRSASGMVIASTSRWRCNSGTPRTSTPISWRRHRCRTNRARILPPATATARGSSRPIMAPMPPGSRAALRMPVMPKRATQAIEATFVCGDGTQSPTTRLTAWPIRNPSLAHREMAIGIARHSRRTRALRGPGTPHTPVAGPGLFGLMTHAVRTRNRLCTSCSLSWSCCSGCRVETPGAASQLPPVVVLGAPPRAACHPRPLTQRGGDPP